MCFLFLCANYSVVNALKVSFLRNGLPDIVNLGMFWYNEWHRSLPLIGKL